LPRAERLWSHSPRGTLGALDLLAVSMNPGGLTSGGNRAQRYHLPPLPLRALWVVDGTFAERLVVGAAVASLQAVRRAAAGVLGVPLLAAAVLRALEASR